MDAIRFYKEFVDLFINIFESIFSSPDTLD